MTNSNTGTLWGVGLGPGDPELITVKAARVIGEADVIAYHCAQHRNSIARSVAEPYLRANQHEEALVYPVTTETTDHPGGYEGAIAEFYELCAKRLAEHLDSGKNVVLLCEGDPFFYGSYMYMHERLADRYPAHVIPGVTSTSAASAKLGRPLAQRDEVLTMLPGTLPAPELAMRLADTDAAAVLKLGRTFDTVTEALSEAGRLDEAWYVERATWGRQRIEPLAQVDSDSVPYFSLALLPSPAYSARVAGAPGGRVRDAGEASQGTGEVVVVGLGPAGPEWLTPEAERELAAAEHLVGYGPYLARVPQRAGQSRHASGNRVEAERAADALELAAGGARVAVVSSGDPGVFAMGSAVLEQAEMQAQRHSRPVPVRIVPGVSAAQAAAARVGAPLGHDYCVLSLSDRLKPWDIIEKRLHAAASADLVLALYNPASKSRVAQLRDAMTVLSRYRSPDTPVVIARDVGGSEESVRIATLGSLDPSDVDMRCVVLVGSSRTRVSDGPDGTRLMWTPRRYD